nr:chitin synthase chs-2 isoform X1 [Crassostrea gigas]
MYMYYFLAHKLAKKRKVAENTFLLALDGDVDFQPKAVQLLVDRMRKNPSVGAACGRIHPIGTGPMVWYQQFEYAVSHWLQKAAENIMGCVLCSPGCFSLFRGSALMDDNVMAKYTTLPTEPRHYVQYDQGEDRWLCTLLLQQGYKVEYVAASDALTYAPEGFYEFYNQRRRWSPSTMANIIDLLMDWKNVTRKNEDISKLYILYQMFLMICSLLTPGTIFLMILGAISMAFPTIPPFAGMLVNLIPVSGMIILCFVAKPNIQLAYAAVVSIFYSLLMMVVLVGILLEAVTAGLCSVTTLFLLFVVGVFFISALLHPQEFYCVLHGFLYLLSIPSMSMLLMIYSLGNLHVISWGTRDTKETAPQLETNDRMPSRSPSFLKSFGFNGDEESEYLFTCGKFIRCCPIRPIRMILERLDNLEAQRIKTTVESEPREIKLDENAYISTLNVQIDDTAEKNNEFEHEQMSSQSWMDDSDLKQGSVAVLDNDETLFWEEFISKYLKPLYTDKEHEEQMRQGLKELRNKVCLAFLLMNALFVTIVFVLTEVNASFNHALSIKLPCTVSEGPPGRGYIEPISIAFTAIFGIMLFLQFICMLMHRISTLVHIVASVKLDWKRKLVTAKNKDQPENVEVEVEVEDGLELVKGLQAVKEDDTISIASTDTMYSVESYVRSKQKSKIMWKKYQKRLKKQTQQQNDYCLQFTNNLKKFTEALEKNDNKSVQKLLENKMKGKAIAAVSTILKNDTKMNEIKIRATALNKKEVVKRRWQDFGAKLGLNKEDENDKNPGKFFKDDTKAALAQEKRKRLEEGDISLGETNVNKIKRETSESRRDIPLDIMKRGTDEKNSIPNVQKEQITSVKTTEL